MLLTSVFCCLMKYDFLKDTFVQRVRISRQKGKASDFPRLPSFPLFSAAFFHVEIARIELFFLNSAENNSLWEGSESLFNGIAEKEYLVLRNSNVAQMHPKRKCSVNFIVLSIKIGYPSAESKERVQ